MGSKDKYTVEQIAHALRQAGGMRAHAAKLLRCSPSTVTNYVERHPELEIVEDDIKNATLDLAESQLIRKIRAGEAWAICFYLKTQGKKRGYIERTEITGKDGGPVEHNLRLPSDERQSKIKTIGARLGHFTVIEGGKGKERKAG